MGANTIFEVSNIWSQGINRDLGGVSSYIDTLKKDAIASGMSAEDFHQDLFEMRQAS